LTVISTISFLGEEPPRETARQAREEPDMGFEPNVVYRDRVAAMQWLQRAFGFETSFIIEDRDGRVGAAQMSFGDGRLWIGEETADRGDDVRARLRSPESAGGLNTQSVEVHMEDGIDAHFSQAQAAGAVIVQELADQFYGARTYRALDPEGHVWTFLRSIPMADDAMTSRGLTVKTSR
jgi:uncharacterized glyoxalase superfamily protein PhnB